MVSIKALIIVFGLFVILMAGSLALILYAPASRFPQALLLIGWIAVVAGVILALFPPAKFQSLIRWAFDRFSRYTRMAALAAVIFCLFLIYAAV